MKISRNNRRGFTLVEVLSYLGLFGIILSVIYSVYYQFSRNLSAADITMLSERNAFHAIQRMQDDLRASTRILENFGPFNASDKCLILETEKGDGSAKDIIIYKLDKSRKTLVRYHASAKQPAEGMSSLSIGEGIKSFNFSVDPESANLLKVSIGMKEGHYGTLHNRPLTFYAAMRNG